MESSGASSVISHDGWGKTSMGEFESLEEARTLFRTLCTDRWFRTDGGIRRLSIVERAGGGTVDSDTVGNSGRG